ncbi:hypothetical protein DL98DRAFT_636189 [Cadophora sp. DSE1049]|nr:hypothetical protein DL98DRAFT_636189 [Cadophora sp. DSE1049]
MTSQRLDAFRALVKQLATVTPGELGKRALLHHPCTPPSTTICSGFVTSSTPISGSSHEVSSFMTRAKSVRQRHRQTGVDRERDDLQLKRTPASQSMRETFQVAVRHVSPHLRVETDKLGHGQRTFPEVQYLRHAPIVVPESPAPAHNSTKTSTHETFLVSSHQSQESKMPFICDGPVLFTGYDRASYQDPRPWVCTGSPLYDRQTTAVTSTPWLSPEESEVSSLVSLERPTSFATTPILSSMDTKDSAEALLRCCFQMRKWQRLADAKWVL